MGTLRVPRECGWEIGIRVEGISLLVIRLKKVSQAWLKGHVSALRSGNLLGCGLRHKWKNIETDGDCHLVNYSVTELESEQPSVNTREYDVELMN